MLHCEASRPGVRTQPGRRVHACDASSDRPGHLQLDQSSVAAARTTSPATLPRPPLPQPLPPALRNQQLCWRGLPPCPLAPRRRGCVQAQIVTLDAPSTPAREVNRSANLALPQEVAAAATPAPPSGGPRLQPSERVLHLWRTAQCVCFDVDCEYRPSPRPPAPLQSATPLLHLLQRSLCLRTCARPSLACPPAPACARVCSPRPPSRVRPLRAQPQVASPAGAE